MLASLPMLIRARTGVAQAAEEQLAEPAALAARYTGEWLRNAEGGLSTGDAYLENLFVELSLGADELLPLRNVTLHASGLYANAATFSERYSGDAQVVSNIDAPATTRLYEAWLQWQSAGKRAASLRMGLYDLNTEFDVCRSCGIFNNSSFGVGHELAQTGVSGPSIFPLTSFALRVSARVGETGALRVAAIDAVPGSASDPAANTVRLSSEDGALLIAEAEGALGPASRLVAGVWKYTKRFRRVGLRMDATQVGTGTSQGGYALAEVPLWHRESDDVRRIDGFFRIGVASDQVNEYARSIQTGLIVRQPFGESREASIALGAARADIGAQLKRLRESASIPAAPYEIAFELTYQVIIKQWLAFQPMLQYVRHPAADPGLEDAFVLGMRFDLRFDSSSIF